MVRQTSTSNLLITDGRPAQIHDAGLQLHQAAQVRLGKVHAGGRDALPVRAAGSTVLGVVLGNCLSFASK